MTKTSCGCGWDMCTPVERVKAKNPSSFTGTLHKLNGTLLSHIPTEGDDTLAIDKIPVRIAILDCGKLQLTSQVATDNKKESIDNARRAHISYIAKVREALERITAEKLEAEELYCDSLVTSDNNDSAQGLLVLQLLAKQKSVAKELKKLENMEELEVKFTTQGGTVVSLHPGIVTVVPFSTSPLVWCPKSLAKLKPIDDKVDVVTVKVLGQLRLETPSEIFCEDMLNDLHQMIRPNDETGMVLHKIHDQTKGMTASSYDQSVRPHSYVLTVIQSSTGQVFGGFYVKPMGSGSGWHAGHKDDFVFSLGKADQDPRMPTKLLKSNNTHSASMHQGCGLHMGDGGDLIAFCSHSAIIPTVFAVPAEGYPSLPHGESIAGAPGAYTPTKMEVYMLCTLSQE